ncbi:MAG TPA: HDOD domain-containing protein [Marinagarivorans sp.]|nr:HDOD domain-containing protein [Marinagarivorans sp.]HNG61481.1 HDOD domain-containing protein [Cellvibrionaceae bacterium]
MPRLVSAMETSVVAKTIAQQLANKIKQKKIDVPMLPEVANRVMRLTQDPNAITTDLAKLVQSDQVLAGHVMRIANSALYSPNTKLVSLQQAISRLGMSIIGEIALAASINSKMFNAPGHNKIIQCQLRYALYTALWAKEVARVCKRNVEAAFLAGLLHDIGRPVCLQATVEIATQCGFSVTNADLVPIEAAFSRALGVLVVNLWEMPAIVCDVLSMFDRYEEAGDNKELTMVVVAASKFAQYGLSINSDQPTYSRKELEEQPVMADLNLYLEDIEFLLGKQANVKSTLESMSL